MDTQLCESLFRGRLGDLITLPKRIGGVENTRQVVWATGDATLTHIAAINWEEKEFVWGSDEEFLRLIAPVHRPILIADTEQLAASCIVVVWGHKDQLLLMGTDNQNVSAWPKKGYSEKGASLVLTQETSRVIAVKQYTAEPYYLRSGHNFSADWTTRTGIKDIMLWAGQHGFKRLRFQPYWGEWMSER